MQSRRKNFCFAFFCAFFDMFLEYCRNLFGNMGGFFYLCSAFQKNAQMAESVDALVMAESVDALVSNTSGVKSIPVRPRVWVLSWRKMKIFLRFLFFLGEEKSFG